MNRVHGHIVKVDWSLCYGCEKCVVACPTDVFVTSRDTTGDSVVDPIRESDCILCLVCEIVCPVDAISIKSADGPDGTLDSLLNG